MLVVGKTKLYEISSPAVLINRRPLLGLQLVGDTFLKVHRLHCLPNAAALKAEPS